MAKLDKQVESHQIAWRCRHVGTGQWGQQNGKEREWILPASAWEEGLWPGIRSGSAWSLPAYLAGPPHIQKHTGAHNLKSSWTLCANLYFPFGHSPEGRALLAGFLQDRVGLAVTSVEGVELEYAEPAGSLLHPSALLGELDGARGSGQTSPDVAFLVNAGKGIVFTESKFTEHSFYRCSARRLTGNEKRPGNPDPGRCDDPMAVLEAPETYCHQASWGRRYWDHLAPCIDPDKLVALKHCPAAMAGYQLFRQQALAEGFAASDAYELVASCVAADARNDVLWKSLKPTGIADASAWEQLFKGKAQFRLFHHQDWVAWVRVHGEHAQWRDWLSWVSERYGFEE